MQPLSWDFILWFVPYMTTTNVWRKCVVNWKFPYILNSFKISDYSLFNNTNSKINTATGTLKFCKITQMIDACQRFPVQSHWFITAFCWHGLSASPLLFWRWRLSLAPVLYAVSWSASVSPLDPPGDPLWPAWTRTYR